MRGLSRAWILALGMVLFSIQSLSAPKSGAEAPSGVLAVSWPGHDIGFVIALLPDHAGLALHRMSSENGVQWIRNDIPRLLPFRPEGPAVRDLAREFRGADVLETSSIENSYLLTVIGKVAFVLDKKGMAVEVPGVAGTIHQVNTFDHPERLVFTVRSEPELYKTYLYQGHQLHLLKESQVAPDRDAHLQVTRGPDSKTVVFNGDPIHLPEAFLPTARVFAMAADQDLAMTLSQAELRLGAYSKHLAFNSYKETGEGGVEQLRKEKREKNDLVKELQSEVFGQDYALERIGAQYREATANGTGKPKVLVAMGPSGSGKTYAAQKLAERLHDGKVFEISGNEYRTHAGSLEYGKLLGSRGGAGNEGALIKFAAENPNGFTFIINEGEKMHSDLWLTLMEFFDTGSITSQNGTKVQVKDLWIVITSNRGATRMFPQSSKNWSRVEIDRRLREFTQQDLAGLWQQKDGLHDRNTLPPEIVKRIDEFLVFGPITRDAVIQIAQVSYKSLNAQYKRKYTVSVDFDEKTLEDVALTAWGISNDARTAGRAVRSLMSEILERAVDELRLEDHGTIRVSTRIDPQGNKSYEASANGTSFTIEAVTNPFENPLLEAGLRKRLLNMRKLMSEIVIGQDDAIAEISDALLSHVGRGRPKRPFSAYLSGPSGNGKTETGRALAKVLYDDEQRYAVIPMGNISDTKDFDTVFGSGAQFQGGDIERIFEKSLRENPNGAVIIMDEASNMGGGNLAMKTAVFQKLYDLFEEGRYISPIDGREYDLSRYQFILTGNDGEQHYRGVSSDDLLMQIWKKISDPDTVREMMREAGIPNAIINRFNVVANTKPLLSHEIPQITAKLWKSQMREFKEFYPGVEVEPVAGMMERISKTYFTSDQGGRSARKVLEDKVGVLVLNAILKSNLDISDLRGVKVEVDFSDSLTSRPYQRSNAPARVVEFKATVYKDGRVVHTEVLDTTKATPKQPVQSSKSALLTAFHEAGHAVANEEQISGEGLRFISVRAGSAGRMMGSKDILKFYGYASYEPLDENASTNLTRAKIVARIASLYAGNKAQQMAGFELDSGWEQDLRMIRELAGAALTRWGLEPSLVALELDKEGNPLVRTGVYAERFELSREKLIREGEILSEQLLTSRWRFVRALAAELMLHGEVDRKRFLELQALYIHKPVTGRNNEPRDLRSQETEKAPISFIQVARSKAPAASLRCERLFGR